MTKIGPLVLLSLAFISLMNRRTRLRNEKGEPTVGSPFSSKSEAYCCAEAARSFFITLTSTRPPLVGFAIVPLAPGTGSLPMLST